MARAAQLFAVGRNLGEVGYFSRDDGDSTSWAKDFLTEICGTVATVAS